MEQSTYVGLPRGKMGNKADKKRLRELAGEKIYKGDVVRQRVGQPHQLEAMTDGTVFEVSTQHFDEDSYRVWKGDSQDESMD